MSRVKARILACRFCGEEKDVSNRDVRSAWTHSHGSVCPHRQDRMPSLNGVHVGDHWINIHTGNVSRVLEIRLGGDGTYTDREPTILLGHIEVRAEYVGQLPLFGPEPEPPLPTLAECEAAPTEPEDDFWFVHATPLWSLAEHSDPLTRPGEYPVPIEERRDRYSRRPMRWTVEEWRCPALRGGSREEKGAYFHAWHRIDGEYTSKGWEWWQVDPNEPAEIPIGQLEIAA